MPLTLSEEEELELLELEEQEAATQMGTNQSSPEKSVLQKSLDVAKWPENKSREGLRMISESIPEQPIQSQSATLNFIGGIPRVAAETLGEAAPGFVSPLSIAGGAVAPGARLLSRGAKAAGPFIAKALSRTSGINPKSLEIAAKDAGTVFKPGVEAANKAYGELLENVPIGARPTTDKARKVYDSIKRVTTGTGTTAEAVNRRVLDNALYLAKNNDLSPKMANVARKALDDLFESKAISRDFVNKARKLLVDVESKSPAIEKAKDIRATAEHVDQLRQLMPLTKSGGTGQFRTMVSGAAALKNPALLPLLGTAFSPATQGAEAALAGLAVRRVIDPISRSSNTLNRSLGAAVSNLRRRKEKQNAK